ncbi:MAG: rod shape-determining protein [Desulfobacteraceae bacterium IS3]|nr:MAG: rod shape-determining protein [Desulfobacteraceae bacterium IS3]
MAIDLGTANTLIYMKQKGIVLNEPSVVAIHESPGMRKQILAIGMDAKKMIGKVPPNIKAVRPMRNGVIADFEVAGVMLRYFIAKVRTGLRLFRPRIIVAVPSGISSVEKRAVKEIGYEAGGREVFLVEEPMAAAIGADVSVIDPVCSMVVDIGGGTTDIAVISLAGIVSGRSLRIAGDKMDLSIQRYIRKKYSFDIGERTAEEIKISIGNAEPDPLYPKIMEVKGWDLVSEKFRIITVNDLEIREAISEQIDSIVETVKMVLDRTSQELTADIVEKGIILTGGVALLKNLNKFFEKEIGLPIRVPENPLTTVALGSGRLLDDPDLLRRVSVV